MVWFRVFNDLGLLRSYPEIAVFVSLQHPQRPLSAGADADSSLGSLNVESTAEHDGDIDEYVSDL